MLHWAEEMHGDMLTPDKNWHSNDFPCLIIGLYTVYGKIVTYLVQIIRLGAKTSDRPKRTTMVILASVHFGSQSWLVAEFAKTIHRHGGQRRIAIRRTKTGRDTIGGLQMDKGKSDYFALCDKLRWQHTKRLLIVQCVKIIAALKDHAIQSQHVENAQTKTGEREA